MVGPNQNGFCQAANQSLISASAGDAFGISERLTEHRLDLIEIRRVLFLRGGVGGGLPDAEPFRNDAAEQMRGWKALPIGVPSFDARERQLVL
jgi:hypothetical protein